MIEAIRSLTEPTDLVVFPHEPRLGYRFSGVTVLYDDGVDDADDPRDDPGVARVIIEENPAFWTNPAVLDEYRFN